MEPNGRKIIDFQEGAARVERERALQIIRELLPNIGSPEDLELRRESEESIALESKDEHSQGNNQKSDPSLPASLPQ